MDNIVDHFNHNYKRLMENDTVNSFLTQADSRYILYKTGENEENFPNYTERLDTRLLEIAYEYLEIAWGFYRIDKFTYKENIYSSLDKAASVLEKLSSRKGGYHTFQNYSLLISSLAYYTSKQYSKSFILIKEFEDFSILTDLLSSFLSKDLTKLTNLIFSILSGITDLGDYDTDNKAYIILLAKTLRNLLLFSTTGNKKYLNLSREINDDLISLAQLNNDPTVWWVFILLRIIVDEFEQASFWENLASIILDEKDLKDYILANLFKEPTNIELFTAQIKGLNIIESNNGNGALTMPTSSGKTKIAEIYIYKMIKENPEAICIYIAPYRSLAYEIETSLSDVLDPLSIKIANLYGGSTSTFLDVEMIEDSHVLIGTQEKIKAIIRANPELKNKIKLLVIDEGHLIGNDERGIRTELLVEELKFIVKENDGYTLLLSAILNNSDEFSEWISLQDRSTLISEPIISKNSRQRTGKLFLTNNEVRINWDNGSFNRHFASQELIEQIISHPKREKDSSRKRSSLASTVVKLINMGPVLLYVPRANMVFTQAEDLYLAFDLSRIEHQWDNTIYIEKMKLICEEQNGDYSNYMKYLEVGIVCHSGQMPRELRSLAEKIISNSNPKVIIATNSLGQGVNIGVSTIVFSSVYPTRTPLSISEFWNIAGRAGRSYVDTESKILFAVDLMDTNQKRQQINRTRRANYYLNQKEAYGMESYSGVYALLNDIYLISKKTNITFSYLLEILSENTVELNLEKTISLDEIREKLDFLDDTLVSILYKLESNDIELEIDVVESIFKKSLAYIQAPVNSYNELTKSNLIDMINSRMNGLNKVTNDQQTRKNIVISNLSLNMYTYISNKLEDIILKGTEFLGTAYNYDSLSEMIIFINKLISDYYRYSEDIVSLIGNARFTWFNGQPLGVLEDYEDNKAEYQKIINNYYQFKFPWIVNSIAKVLKQKKRDELAILFEQIALMGEYGLHNDLAIKVYLYGVQSRESATELSQYLLGTNSLPIQLQLNNLYMLKDNNFLSEQSLSWLKIVVNEEKNRTDKKLIVSKKYYLNFETPPKNDVLFIRKYESSYYLCSSDYEYIVKWLDPSINQKDLEIIATNLGIYFQKLNDTWKIETINPFITIRETVINLTFP